MKIAIYRGQGRPQLNFVEIYEKNAQIPKILCFFVARSWTY